MVQIQGGQGNGVWWHKQRKHTWKRSLYFHVILLTSPHKRSTRVLYVDFPRLKFDLAEAARVSASEYGVGRDSDRARTRAAAPRVSAAQSHDLCPSS